MICFDFFVFESKVGSLSTSMTTLQLGLSLGWQKSPSVPTPPTLHQTVATVSSLPPVSQGIMPLSQLLDRPLRLLPSISVVPLFREHRRYFYVNDRTSASQWDFPTEENKDEEPKSSQDSQTQASSPGDSKPPPAPAGMVTCRARCIPHFL